jgi:hydroxyquinol 1,2-dioxygenase
MRDFNEDTITSAVVESFRDTPDPRVWQIMTSLVTHLHGFVRDVDLTLDEWLYAINFLTRTGHICDDKRQEFILLSDTLGVSMLVDAINHRMPGGATETTVLGPFYVAAAPVLPHGSDISRGLPGAPLFVEGQVTSANGAPLAGASVDVWQADADGYYDVQRPDLDQATLRAQFQTDADGHFHFWSVAPSSYPIPDDGPVGELLRGTGRHPNRPAHVHFMIAMREFETLVTHVFAADSPFLDDDAVFGVKNSLIADFTHEAAGTSPDGTSVAKPWRKLSYHFGLKPLRATGPRA